MRHALLCRVYPVICAFTEDTGIVAPTPDDIDPLGFPFMPAASAPVSFITGCVNFLPQREVRGAHFSPPQKPPEEKDA